MSPDPTGRALPEDVFAAIAAQAAVCDRTGSFPAAAFDALRHAGLIADPPTDPGSIAPLLRILAEVGRGDLSVGRIFEGHVNAMLLIRRHATAEQRRHLEQVARGGGVFGVWNTDVPGDPVTLDGDTLSGCKNFASGVDGLSQAIITAGTPEGRRMIVLPVGTLPVDRSWWRPLGMHASGSHIVDFSGLTAEPGWLLGACDDYIQEPWFSAGAMRFAAVQLGGMHAVFDEAVAHLRRTGRAASPHQLHRVAEMSIALQSGYQWIARAAQAWQAMTDDPPGRGAAAIAVANAARSAIEAHALALLEDVERGVGFAAFMAPHPLERMMRDMRTYLRQPNPDGALASLGGAVLEGTWFPGPIEP